MRRNFCSRALVSVVLTLCYHVANADAIDDAKELLLANDYIGAYQKLQEPAAQGDAEAQYQLASLYRAGLGTTADNAQALLWYQRAAQQNHAGAQYMLATLYEKGLGTAVDNGAALQWYQRAARNGNALAHQKVATLAQSGAVDTNTAAAQLLHAARKGDIEQLKTLLAQRVAIDATDEQGNTALMLAAQTGNAAVALLLEAGAQVNNKNRSGDNALLLAAAQNKIDNIDALLAHGAAVDVVDSNGNTALLIAASKGDTPACAALLAHNSAVDTKNLSGDSALVLARRQKNTELIRLLRAHGAKDSGGDKNIVTVNSDIERARNFSNSNDTGYAGWPPLQIAAWRGDKTLVDALLRQGAVLDAVDAEGYTALGRAVFQGNIAVAQRLLDAGSNVNLGGSIKAPLLIAIERGYAALVDLLLQRGAQPNVQTPDGGNALAFAAKNADEAIVLSILTHHPDVDARSEHKTALLWCARRGLVQAARTLLEQHADIGARDGEQRTALWYAATNDREAIVELLLQRHADLALADNEGVTPLASASVRGNVKVVALLLRYSAVVDSATREGNTPLLLAARSGRADIVQMLLAAKADVEHRNNKSETALMLAAASGSVSAVDALLKAGVDPKRRDKSGRTAVEYAKNANFAALAQRLQDHIDNKKGFSLF